MAYYTNQFLSALLGDMEFCVRQLQGPVRICSEVSPVVKSITVLSVFFQKLRVSADREDGGQYDNVIEIPVRII